MTRRERLEARAERLQGWADKREQDAGAVLQSHERYRGDHAFNFQPGHIPERARVIAQADRAFESLDKARGMAARADGIEQQLASSIYSDDVDAVEQLRAKIGRLEGERDRIKAFNASCRKGAADVSLLDDRQRAYLESVARHCPYQLGRRGEMPAYVLSNLSGNIARNRKRLEQVERMQQMQAAGDRGRPRVMSSRYAGTCPDCGESFERVTREAVCKSCGEAV